jgi:hypothetical protein
VVTFGSGSLGLRLQIMALGGGEMNAVQRADSRGDVISRWWRGRTAEKSLLLAAVAAVVVYAIGDVVSALLYDGYSYRDQAISELSAFGSPVRPLMVTAIHIHNVLLLAFGIGLMLVARRRSVCGGSASCRSSGS